MTTYRKICKFVFIFILKTLLRFKSFKKGRMYCSNNSDKLVSIARKGLKLYEEKFK